MGRLMSRPIEEKEIPSRPSTKRTPRAAYLTVETLRSACGLWRTRYLTGRS